MKEVGNMLEWFRGEDEVGWSEVTIMDEGYK